MNHELAATMKGMISHFPFVDVLAGLVKTAETSTPNDDDGTVKRQKFPVAWDTNIGGNCHAGAERDLIPDSSRRSIIYFEDLGTNITRDGRNGDIAFAGTVRLVGWLNRNRLVGNPYQEVSAHIIAAIIGKLNMRYENLGIFKRLSVYATRVPPQDQNLFSRYTYDETVRQFLMPPYEAFGIDFASTYRVNPGCMADIDFTQYTNC